MKISKIPNYTQKPSFKGAPMKKELAGTKSGIKQIKKLKIGAIFALGALTVLGYNKINTSIKDYNDAKPIIIEKNEKDETMLQTYYKTIDAYDIPNEFIIAYNVQVADNSIFEENKVIIPKKYNYLQENIDELKRKSYNHPEMSEEIENQIELLEAKRDEQNCLKTICHDEKGNVYIYIERGYMDMSADDFMKLFDVDKDAIENWLRENRKDELIYEGNNTDNINLQKTTIPRDEIIVLKKKNIGNVIHTDFKPIFRNPWEEEDENNSNIELCNKTSV